MPICRLIISLHNDIKLEVEVPEVVNLNHLPKEQQDRIFKLITGVIEAYRCYGLANSGQPNILVLHIQKLENALYISVEFEGSLQERESLHALHTLVEQLGNEEGFFVEGLHNKQESVMEFYVPLSLEAEVKG